MVRPKQHQRQQFHAYFVEVAVAKTLNFARIATRSNGLNPSEHTQLLHSNVNSSPLVDLNI